MEKAPDLRSLIKTIPKACPKCEKEESPWKGPRYREVGRSGTMNSADCLVWTCMRCDFELETPCLDALHRVTK